MKAATIEGLSSEGVEFILETKDQSPKAMEFYFLDEVSEELRQQLESGFDVDSVGGIFDARTSGQQSIYVSSTDQREPNPFSVGRRN